MFYCFTCKTAWSKKLAMSEVNTRSEHGSQDLDLYVCGHSVMLGFFFH